MGTRSPRVHAQVASLARMSGSTVPEHAEGAGGKCWTTAKGAAAAALRGSSGRDRACRFGQEQLSARESALQDAAACAYSSRSSGITLWPSSSRSSSSTSAGSSPCRAQRRTHHASHLPPSTRLRTAT